MDEKNDDRYVILHLQNLKEGITKNCACKKCSIIAREKEMDTYFDFRDTEEEEDKKSLVELVSKLDKKDNKKTINIIEKQIAYLPSARSRWGWYKNFFSNKTCKDGKFKNLLNPSDLKIESISVGLATYLNVVCHHKLQQCDGHKWTIEPIVRIGINQNDRSTVHNYKLNITSVLESYQLGMGHHSLQRFFAFLGIRSLHQKSFAKCETSLGELLTIIAEESMEGAREEEKRMTLLQDPKTVEVAPCGLLVPIVVSIDMGWNKRNSGRLYDFPSGISHMIGTMTKKSL